MIGDKQKKGNRIAVLCLLALVSCGKPGAVDGPGIHFLAKSEASITKTSYSGEREGGKERIDWVEGDLIRIYSPEAQTSGEQHVDDYAISSPSTSGVNSSGTLASVHANGLQWLDESTTHHFFCIYPSPTTEGMSGNVSVGAGASSGAGRVACTIPASQSMSWTTPTGEVLGTPDMKYAYMYASKETVYNSSVELLFNPLYTAFQIEIGPGEFSEIHLSSFTLSSTSTAVAGDFVNEGVPGSEVVSSSSETMELTVPLTDQVLTTGNTLKFTFFALPQTLTDLTLTFTGTEIGTRRLALKDNLGASLSLEPCKKYRIYGMNFPNISSYQLEVEDLVIWHYTPEPDNISWEGIDHLVLSESDPAYLWRTQTLTRRVLAISSDGDVYANAAVEWSASPEGVVAVNAHTGEVRAVAPGEAIVTATVTPAGGGDPLQASYNVYVNAPAGVTLSAEGDTFVSPDDPEDVISLTAHVTGLVGNGGAGYGTPTAYPTDLLSWSSSNPSHLTFVGTPGTQPVMASGLAQARVRGVSFGTSNISVRVNYPYIDSASDILNCSCGYENGGPFNGIYLSQGVMYKCDGEEGYALYTDWTGGLESYAFSDVPENVARGNVYFSWEHLAFLFDSRTPPDIPSSANNESINNERTPVPDWRLPTSDDVSSLFNVSAARSGSTVRIGSSTVENCVFALVVVHKAGTGISNASGTAYVSFPSAYQMGILVFPDGREFETDFSFQDSDSHSVINSTDYIATGMEEDQLNDFLCGGCAFLPAMGYYNAGTSTWDTDISGHFWLSTSTNNNEYAFSLYFETGFFVYSALLNNIRKVSSLPVRLVRTSL